LAGAGRAKRDGGPSVHARVHVNENGSHLTFEGGRCLKGAKLALGSPMPVKNHGGGNLAALRGQRETFAH
jgi:hypothetical protein